jgi:hypothetical protein
MGAYNAYVDVDARPCMRTQIQYMFNHSLFEFEFGAPERAYSNSTSGRLIMSALAPDIQPRSSLTSRIKMGAA